MTTIRASSKPFTSPFNEMQLVVRLARHPEELSSVCDAETLIDTPLCKATLAAIRKKRTDNLGILAEAMKSEGFPGMNAGLLKAELFDVVDRVIDVETVDPHLLYDELARLFMIRTGIPVADKWMAKVKSGKLSMLEAIRGMEGDMIAYADMGGVEYVSTNNWDAAFTRDQFERAERVKSGKALFFPEFLPVFHDKLGLMEYGVYVIIGDSGVSKTDVAQMIAEDIADHGEKVVFGSTEASAMQMARRTILRSTDGITNDELLRGSGYDQAKAIAALQRFKGTGEIIYPRMKRMRLKSLISIADRNDAHLIIDLFHDCNLSDYRQPGLTYFDVLAEALEDLHDWAIYRHKVVWITIQIKNESRMAVRTTGRMIMGVDANGGSAYESKTVGMFVLNTPRTVDRYNLPDPYGGPNVMVPRGVMSPLSVITTEKGREFAGGIKQVVWMDRAHRRIYGYKETQGDFMMEYINQMYKDIKERSTGKPKK